MLGDYKFKKNNRNVFGAKDAFTQEEDIPRFSGIKDIIKATREQNFTSPYIHEPEKVQVPDTKLVTDAPRKREADKVTQGVLRGLSSPVLNSYQELGQAGDELKQGKIGSGILDALKGTLHTVMTPITAPISAVTEGLKGTGEVGGEVAKGLEKTMQLPFDAIKYGSDVVNKALKEIGIDASDSEWSSKANELIQEVGGLYVMGKTHRSIKSYLDKKLPEIKVLAKDPELVIKPQETTPTEGLTQEKLPTELLKPEVTEVPKVDFTKPVKEIKTFQDALNAETPEITNFLKKEIGDAEVQKLMENASKRVENEIPTEGGTTGDMMAKAIEDELRGKAQEIVSGKTNIDKTIPVKNEVIGGKVAKASNDINKTLVGKGFDELPPEELSRYSPITKKEQIEKTSNLVDSNYESAKNIAFGKETPPNDVHPQVLFNAVKNKAILENDVQTLKELAISPIAKQRSEAAQTLGASGFNNGDMPVDPIKAIQEVIKTREESPSAKRNAILEKTYQEKVKTLEDRIAKQEERIKNIESEKSYRKIQREESAKIRKEKRQVTKELLDKDFNDVIGEFVKSYKPNALVDPAQIKILLRATRIKAQQGITDIAQVVDDIYMALADKIEGITKRDIRDAISGYGKTVARSKDELTVLVNDLKRQAELVSKIEDLSSGQNVSKRQINKNKQTEELQKLQGQLKLELEKSDIVQFEKLEDTKIQIKNKIQEITKKIETGDYEKPDPKIKSIDDELTGLKTQLKDIREKYNDVSKNLKDKISNEEVKIISELSKATIDAKQKMDSTPMREVGKPQTPEEQVYGDAYTTYTDYVDNLKTDANKMTWEEFKQSPAMNFVKALGHVPGMTKSLKATFDNSGLFNQNLRVLLTHPTIWSKNALKSFQDIWNVLGGKNVMKMINSDKVSRPNYRNGAYKKEKLAVGTVEEQYPDSKLLEKVPVLGKIHKAAETAFTGLAYRNRMDVFDLLVEHAKNVNADYTGIGKVVNSLTGRGSLGKFEGGADILNVTLFSPRFLKSHIDVLTAHLFSKNMSKFARKEAALNLLKIIGGLAATTTAINAVRPNTIEIDPRSTDFAKIKIGETRFGYTGGLGSVITLASRLAPLLARQDSYVKKASGELSKLNTGEYGSRNGLNVLVDFMQGKSAPLAGLGLSRLEGVDYTGGELTTGGELSNLATPLPIQNFVETANNPDSANLLLVTIADALGIFTQTYKRKQPDFKP